MKLSSNSVGMLIFTALAIAVFVFMALRPAVEGNAMNLGIPLNTEMATATESSDTRSVTNDQSESVGNTELESSAPKSTEEAKPTTEKSDMGTEPETEEKPTTTD